MTPETIEQEQAQEEITRYEVTSAVTCDLSNLQFDADTGTASLGSGDSLAFALRARNQDYQTDS